MEKWTNKSATEGKTLCLELVMQETVSTSKKGNKFHSLANIGSAFGGSQIGVDNDGNRIMAKVSIYKKPANEVQTSGNTQFVIK